MKVYGVSELTRRIRTLLEDDLGTVWVEGEISGLRRPASGHCYFTLKDDRAQLSGVLFRRDAAKLDLALEDGMQVRGTGRVTVYEPRGQYQVVFRRLEAAGRGALMARFEELKRKLDAEGLFAPERKRPLPMLPRCIGVVTSPTGAAIRDIIQVLDRRFPDVHLLLAPAKVQGAGAAEEIATAIEALNALPSAGGGRGPFRPDVLIAGRGGGSLEDLWAFNEERVARAVAASAVPVISAVGHEVDFTICDFAADHRAPTPSAAAELVVGRKADFRERLDRSQWRMRRLAGQQIARLRHRVDLLAGSYVFREPSQLIGQHRQRLDGLDRRMRHALNARTNVRPRLAGAAQRLQAATRDAVREARRETEGTGTAMRVAVRDYCASRRHAIERAAGKLDTLNPFRVLDRGYSLTRREDGSVVRSASDLARGARLITVLSRGEVESTVDRIREDGTHDRRAHTD
ncbi:exodeoxyribonuclease VII large subunit [Kiritimatiella glycovorans]|uniref:Exodeoxyribonuclease 7 large subunit n=1 Tax=Kiritimatiella glycovorans TaxID=1307763 RepID=A0A0G3EK41_9BACT|nr:exodeoxyribonuclease VII large subunit [Kiritimatiella glycovorans]AKJ64514.1 Exodeoxyribonuclease 7 large subunit [Kiritimatiella glycovorans]